MKKTRIIAIVIAILVVVLIAVLIIININKSKKQNIDGEQIIETVAETFNSQVIAVENNNITVLSDENAAISSTSRVIKVRIVDKTQIVKNGIDIVKDEIKVGMNVKISFDGRLLSTNPLVINADKIELEETEVAIPETVE